MIHSLKSIQFIPGSLEEAWDFFASPRNLKDITPAYMGFRILNEIPDKMYPGLVISYNIRPLKFYPVNWITEITHVREMEYFIDSQLSGPYGIWHHEHRFRKTKGGVEMTDLLYYKLPFGWMGRLINFFFIRKKVEGIFLYRHKVLCDKFGISGPDTIPRISIK
jgi:ligand-binding SRPBCC domain-containing protein